MNNATNEAPMNDSAVNKSPMNEAQAGDGRVHAKAGAFTITLAAAARTLRAQGIARATDDAVSAWYAAHAGHPSVVINGEPVLMPSEMDALRAHMQADASERYDAPGTCTLCGKENVPLPFKNAGVYDGSARVCADCGPRPDAPPAFWSRPRADRKPAGSPAESPTTQRRELLTFSAAGWTLRAARTESGGLTIDIKREAADGR